MKNNNNFDSGQGISVQYSKKRIGTTMTSLHCHDHYEIYFQLEGTRTYFIDNNRYPVNAGDVILISKNMLHKTVSCDAGAYSRIVVYFTDQSIPDCLQDVVTKLFSYPTLSLNNAEEIKKRFFDLFETEKSDEPYKTEWMKCRLFELLLSLTKSEQKNGVADDFISATTAFLKEHLSEPLLLPDVAAHFSFSPSHFSRKFKKEAGVGYQEYLIGLRTQLAKELLEESDMNITEIAGQCGFEDSNYFSSVFRRVYKMSPRSYRQSIFEPKADRVNSPVSDSPDF